MSLAISQFEPFAPDNRGLLASEGKMPADFSARFLNFGEPEASKGDETAFDSTEPNYPHTCSGGSGHYSGE